MGQASLKLRRMTNGWAHWCPACEEMHVYQVGVEGRPNWSFDGNIELPSFTPSMRVRWIPHRQDAKENICHYFLTAGKLSYCGDSTHALAGQTVDLPDLPAHLRDE